MYLCMHMCKLMFVSIVSRGARRGTGSSGLGVTGGCEWCPFWVLGPLQELYMLLTAESSLQHYDWEFLIVNDWVVLGCTSVKWNQTTWTLNSPALSITVGYLTVCYHVQLIFFKFACLLNKKKKEKKCTY